MPVRKLWDGEGTAQPARSSQGWVKRSLLFCRVVTRVNSTRGSHRKEGNHPSLQGLRAWWHIMDPVLLTRAALGGLGLGQYWAVLELLGLQSSARGAMLWENHVQGGEQAWGWGRSYSGLKGWGKRVTCDMFWDILMKHFSWTEFSLSPSPISNVLCYTEQLVSWKTLRLSFLCV